MTVATSYDSPERDKFNQGPDACTGKAIDPDQLGMAHRTLKCGSHVLLFAPRTNRAVIATVTERGPYGINAAGIDLPPATSKALKSNGWEAIIMVKVD